MRTSVQEPGVGRLVALVAGWVVSGRRNPGAGRCSGRREQRSTGEGVEVGDVIGGQQDGGSTGFSLMHSKRPPLLGGEVRHLTLNCSSPQPARQCPTSPSCGASIRPPGPWTDFTLQPDEVARTFVSVTAGSSANSPRGLFDPPTGTLSLARRRPLQLRRRL